jgi:bifunctional DNA-binding transcriptional regulator/antitoxin component of YhaV-PrlF toxin-antitoxin module
MDEEIIKVVKAYEVGQPDALVVVIPSLLRKKLGIAKGTRFIVKVDSGGRLIYEILRPLHRARAITQQQVMTTTLEDRQGQGQW